MFRVGYRPIRKMLVTSGEIQRAVRRVRHVQVAVPVQHFLRLI